ISKQAGFTLDEIRDMLRLLQKSNPARATWQPVVERKLQEIEAVITQYQQMHQILTTMLTCDMDKLTLELLMEEDCEALETSMLGQADCFIDDGCAG
ncbi:MAG: MerR family DNA-binding protein, partial [Chloroflexota bacterium]